MRLAIFILVAASAAAGCNTVQLRFTTMRQMESGPDIYNQQVLENLANTALEPAKLPYFATLDSGIPQVVDKATIGGYLSYPAQSIVKQLHQQRGGQLGPLTGERDVQANWTLKPVNDDSRLTAMRDVYLWILQKPLANKDEADKLLRKYITSPHNKQTNESMFTLDMIPQGWFKWGRRSEMPEGVRYTVHHHGTYFWVVPGAEEELTKLSITMLRIANTAKRQKSVVRYYYNREGRLIQQETTTEGFEPTVDPGDLVIDGKNSKQPKKAMYGEQADSDDAMLDTSPDPDIKLDTLTNPEISPGLITQPH